MLRIPSGAITGEKISRQALLGLLAASAIILALWFLVFGRWGIGYAFLAVLAVIIVETWKLRWVRLLITPFIDEGYIELGEEQEKVLDRMEAGVHAFTLASSGVQVISFALLAVLRWQDTGITVLQAVLCCAISLLSIVSYARWARSYPGKLAALKEKYRIKRKKKENEPNLKREAV